MMNTDDFGPPERCSTCSWTDKDTSKVIGVGRNLRWIKSFGWLPKGERSATFRNDSIMMTLSGE
jgi:hypothetical protein